MTGAAPAPARAGPQRPTHTVPLPTTPPETIVTDALVIGAGPVGLFQVFELGLLDIRAHVVDALPHIGGQPVQLYPDKPIYDIPGVPVCSGQELADALRQQCAPFQPRFHLNQTVTALEPQTDGGFALETRLGTRFLAKTVFIAAGVGAFEPKRLTLDGAEALEGRQLYYHASAAGSLLGEHVLILGDDDHAVGTALSLAERPRGEAPASVTLMHRRDSLRAEAAMVERLHQRCAQGAMRFAVGQLSALRCTGGRLQAVDVTPSEGEPHTLPVDALLVLQGLSPRLGPLSQWGLPMERKQLVVDTATFSTHLPGVFAVGDINSYPGKRKLLVCGFHECTLAAYAAAAIVYPDRPVQLQYTTTSPHLHALLRQTG